MQDPTTITAEESKNGIEISELIARTGKYIGAITDNITKNNERSEFEFVKRISELATINLQAAKVAYKKAMEPFVSLENVSPGAEPSEKMRAELSQSFEKIRKYLAPVEDELRLFLERSDQAFNESKEELESKLFGTEKAEYEKRLQGVGRKHSLGGKEPTVEEQETIKARMAVYITQGIKDGKKEALAINDAELMLTNYLNTKNALGYVMSTKFALNVIEHEQGKKVESGAAKG